MYYDTLLLWLFTGVLILFSIINASNNRVVTALLHYPIIMLSLAWLLVAIEYAIVLLRT